MRLPLNVRWLMYQTLIFAAVTSDDARGLAAAFDAKDMERAADALVDGVRRDVEVGRDLLRRQMIVHQPQAVELAGRQPRDAQRNYVVRLTHLGRRRKSRRTIRILQCNPQIGHNSRAPRAANLELLYDIL